MSSLFTFGRNGNNSNSNNNMATTDVDDSCLFESSMHAGHYHHHLDLATYGQEGGTNIDMPPPPAVYPNKKRCIGNNKNGESSTTMSGNDENERAEFNVIGTNNNNNDAVEEWNGGSPKEAAQDNRKGTEPKQGTTDDGEDGEEEESAAEWNALVDEIQAGDPDSLYCQDLQIWQDGVTSRKHADQCIHEAFQTCEKALDGNVDFMIQGVAVPIHEHCHNTLTKRFNDIANSISSNHSRRQDLLKRLHDRNSEWGKTYRTLKARVQNDKEMPNEEVQQGNDENIRPDPLETIVEESDGDKKEEASNKKDEEGGNVEEPDWNTIAQEHEPNRDNIRRLLEARDEMEAAEERLAASLQDINACLKECTVTILQAAVELHQDATERLAGRQVDIQESLASNFRRNQQLEKAIEESAKQAQGVFSSLMARLKATPKSALSGPTAAGGANAPRRK